MKAIYFNDKFLDGRQISVDVTGRGFSFGFGVFETIKFLQGKPCFFAEHLGRLSKASSALGFRLEFDEAALRENLLKLVEEENESTGVFKILVHEAPEGATRTMFVRSLGIDENPEAISLCYSPLVKASRAFSSRHKTLNYLDSILELERIQGKGFGECVFSNEWGRLTECSMANLFLFKEGRLLTPRLENGLLDGIVRRKVMSVAGELSIRCDECDLEEKDLLEADEVFITSSGLGPRPVASYRSKAGLARRYRIELLPKIRAAFLDLEKANALGT